MTFWTKPITPALAFIIAAGGIGSAVTAGNASADSSRDVPQVPIADISNGAVTIPSALETSDPDSGPIWNDPFIRGLIVNLTRGFVIDHPLDPLNKLLFHSFIGSPKPKSLYDGIAELDEKGEASVALPDYFETLNEDYNYLLSPIGSPMPNLHIKQEITGNRFLIGGGNPRGHVSWQVTGVRRDAFTRANPFNVEVEKAPHQLISRGECLFAPLCATAH